MKCCVIIPVGPGHQDIVSRAKDSVARAVSHGQGLFDEIQVLEMDDSQGLLGRSHVRNLAVKEAGNRGIDWLFFLDADDVMCPSAFVDVASLLPTHDAIWGAIFVADLKAGQVSRRENQISPIDSLEQVLLNDPYLTLQMGHFVRQGVAEANAFDTELDTGEDFDYYLRLWKDQRCIKIDTPLFLNIRGQHSTGPRAASGNDWRKAINQVFAAFCRNNDVVASIPLREGSLSLRLSNTLDPIQALLAQERLHDGEELIEVLRRLPQDARLIDVGAHLGSHSLFLVLAAHAASLDSYEVDPELAEYLEYNLRLNDLDPERYRAHQAIVGAGPNNPDKAESLFGRMDLKDYSQPLGHALDALHPDAGCHLLRIDRPGLESGILRGAARLIEKNRPLILARAMNDNKGRLIAWSEDNGYQVARVFEYSLSSNYLLVPNEGA